MYRGVSYIGLPWNVGFFHFFSPLAPQPFNYTSSSSSSGSGGVSDSTDAASKSAPVKILHYEPCNKAQKQSEICVRKSSGVSKNATKYLQADRTGVKRLKRSTTVATPKSSKAAASNQETTTEPLENESKVARVT